MGNGPSLSDTQMGLLIGEQSWATGRIHLLYDRTFWRPTRYWSAEHITTDQQKEDFIFHIDQGYECWVRRDLVTKYLSHVADNVTPWSPCPGGHTGALKYLPDGKLNTRFPKVWHTDPGENWLCKAGPTFNVMLQQAYHEGWNPIYLLGCDLGYKPTGERDPNHFQDDYAIFDYDEARAKNEEETQTEMHYQAWSAFRQKGISVYNATKGGTLDIYPRKPLKEVFDISSGRERPITHS